MGNNDSPKKSKILMVVIFIGLGLFILLQYRQFKTQWVPPPEPVNTNGPGHYMYQITHSPPGQIEALVGTAGRENCGSFVAFVTGRGKKQIPAFGMKTLDMKLEARVLGTCANVQGISGESVWEGMKEINSLVPPYQNARAVYLALMKKNSEKSKKVSGDREAAAKRIKIATAKMNYFYSRMEQIAALVLNQMPDEKRRALLTSLERGSKVWK